MESLYCLSIRYLVKNYNLINFKNLNPVVSSDLMIAIKNRYYLKQNIKCRVVYNWAAIVAYVIKNHTNARLINECQVIEGFVPKYENNSQIIDGFVQLWDNYVYDTTSGKIYGYSSNYVRQFKHFIEKGSDFLQKHKNILKSDYLAFEEIAFNEFPDLLKWATENNYISIPIFIPLNVVSNYKIIINKQDEQIWEHHYL
ncbi:Hypothetical protein PACV_367 [Pacmanvirus A23]|uniref:Hypothetical protein n=1 Tax=Pacmanvirus A23 TaxID=1932881 RepID=UPI000A09512E|nr:Hypothetical protein B9W72_gp363 [Pacmanvirus A23]SIP86080.1 Hypothetical protein PACV_367 [Pacmanvirus A23]